MMDVLLTGVSGSGKTSILANVIKLARDRGLTVGGFISPAVYENGENVGADILNVYSGRRAIISRKKDRADFDGEPVCEYLLNRDGIQLGEAALRRTACDLIIIDEIGPYELKGGGYMREASKVIGSQVKKVVVVRPRLVKNFLEKFPGTDFTLYDTKLEQEDVLPVKIVNTLMR